MFFYDNWPFIFMPPLGLTDRQRHYVIDLSVCPSICPSICSYVTKFVNPVLKMNTPIFIPIGTGDLGQWQETVKD